MIIPYDKENFKLGAYNELIKQNYSFSTFPQEMKGRTNWGLWIAAPGKDKASKVPCNALGDDFDHHKFYMDYVEAFQTYKGNPELSGLGFSTKKGVKDGEYQLLVIDYDKCLGEDGQLKPDFATLNDFIKFLGTYTEVSQGGNGLHSLVWVKNYDKTQGCKGKLNGVEMVDMFVEARYVAVTGQVWNGLNEIAKIDDVSFVYDMFDFKGAKIVPVKPKVRKTNTQPVSKIIEKIRSSKQPRKEEFLRLFEVGYDEGDDRSAKDMSFFNTLAYWTECDPRKMREVASESAIYSVLQEKGESYISRTINSAINTYEERIKDTPDEFFDGGKFIPYLLAEKLKSETSFKVAANGKVWRFDNGVYLPDGENYIRLRCNALLKHRFRSGYLGEVVAQISTSYPPETFFEDRNAIPFKNGLLLWRTMTIKPYDGSMFVIQQIPHDWSDQFQATPKFDQFLSDTFAGDKERIRLIWEMIGYCLIAYVGLQKAFLLIGSGCNGKSVLINLIQLLFGSANISNETLKSLNEKPFSVYNLLGKMLNTCTDLSNAFTEDNSMFKRLVDGSSIMIEKKFEQGFSYTWNGKMIFSANDFPRSGDKTEGHYRRWVIIPFDNVVPDDKRVDYYEEVLIEEAQAIFYKAVLALQDLMKRGKFEIPQKCNAMLDDYKVSNDPVLAFVKETFVVGDSDQYVLKQSAVEAFGRWCKSNGYKQAGKNTLLNAIRKEFPSVTEKRVKSGMLKTVIDKGGSYAFVGLSIIDETFFDKMTYGNS